VVDYFSDTYLSGKTPNPCLVCNPKIKFGRLLNELKDKSHAYLATGHYAIIETDKNGICHLLKGVDPHKDQSYFLSFLNQSQLKKIIFPLGSLLKSETRKIASEHNLFPSSESESQDICFINHLKYSDFLMKHSGLKAKPGKIMDANGIQIGIHPGLHKFTIGQRKGINCPAKEPYYVLKTDIKKNELIVGSKQDLYRTECFVTDVNWIHSPPKSGDHLFVKIRYSHKAIESQIIMEQEQTHILFSEPQPSVTPGQGAVFYKNNEVLGAGFIQ